MGHAATTARVLVVDDDEMVRRVIRRILEKRGLLVDDAADLDAARALLLQHPPALILLDLDVGGENGLELLSATPWSKAGTHAFAAPVIVLSGYCDEATIQRSYAAGATDFLSKPIVPAVLESRVASALRAQSTLAELERSRTSLAHAQRLARIGSFEIDLTARTVSFTDEARRIFGLEPSILSPTVEDLIGRVADAQRGAWREWLDRVTAGAAERPFELRVHRDDLGERVVRVQAERSEGALGDQCTMAEGSPPGWLLCVVHDITDRKRVEEELEYQALHDELTGLGNRRQFLEQIEQGLLRAVAARTHLAILFLDLDRFKAINESLGHSAGDRLLVTVAQRLRDSVRRGDGFSRVDSAIEREPISIARLGGDEFTLLLGGLANAQDAAKVAHRILEVLARPFEVDGREIFVTTCVGIAVFPVDKGSPAELLKSAETAMYYAKEQGANRFVYFEPAMNRLAIERLQLDAALRKALERNELEVWYQPRVELVRNRIVGMEALVRWRHPTHGLVPPSQFIPLAEETGLIHAIGEFVLRVACVQCRDWREQGFPELRIAVNLSAEQFRQHDLGSIVSGPLAAAGLPPASLELELTESMLMRDVEENITVLERLKAMGIHLSVDDFGTGYSSLAYLKRFPIDCLKIDRSFVKDVTTKPEDAAITSTIVVMAHNLGLDVVAEGVENEGQLDFLRAQKCDQVQGYYFSRPVTAADATKLLLAQLVEPLAS